MDQFFLYFFELALICLDPLLSIKVPVWVSSGFVLLSAQPVVLLSGRRFRLLLDGVSSMLVHADLARIASTVLFPIWPNLQKVLPRGRELLWLEKKVDLKEHSFLKGSWWKFLSWRLVNSCMLPITFTSNRQFHEAKLMQVLFGCLSLCEAKLTAGGAMRAALSSNPRNISFKLLHWPAEPSSLLKTLQIAQGRSADCATGKTWATLFKSSKYVRSAQLSPAPDLSTSITQAHISRGASERPTELGYMPTWAKISLKS